MDYDEDDYIEEESLLDDEVIEDVDSEDYVEVDTSSGNDFSYNQNPYNTINYSQNDVNNIKERINNRKIINNNINTNTGVNNTSNTLEKKDGLEDKDNLEKKENLEKDLTHETAKKAAGKVAESYGGKAAGKVAEKAVDSEVGREIVDKASKKIKKTFKLKFMLGGALSFFLILLLISIVATILVLPFALLGFDLGDFSLNTSASTSYTNLTSGTYLWPIGSKETSEKNGVTYALGTPVSTSITSNYGKRKDPLTGQTKTHNGVDIGSVSAGKTPVIAANKGVVVKVVTGCKSYGDKSCGGGYGNHIMISHSDGKYTLYAHLHQNTIIVKKNDKVDAGQVIAKTGSSGRSTGAHLHFEVRTNSINRTNPLNYIDAKNPRPITTYEF